METEDAKRWFSWPRFVRSRSAGSPFLVMHTWCPPVRVGYGSRASGRLASGISSEHFFNIRHFARETTPIRNFDLIPGSSPRYSPGCLSVSGRLKNRQKMSLRHYHTRKEKKRLSTDIRTITSCLRDKFWGFVGNQRNKRGNLVQPMDLFASFLAPEGSL